MAKKINSRRKGKEGELELSTKMREIFGINARRGQQFSGSPDSPDIVTDFDFLHIECKRVNKLNIQTALEQSIRDSKEGQIPVVIHRADRQDWKITFRLSDVPEFLKQMERFATTNNQREEGERAND